MQSFKTGLIWYQEPKYPRETPMHRHVPIAKTADSTAPILALIKQMVTEAVAEALADHTPAPSLTDSSRLLNKREVCERWGISPAKFDRMCRSEGVPFVLCGQVRRFRMQDLDRWLEKQSAIKAAA